MNGRPLDEVVVALSKIIHKEGKSPRIETSPWHEHDALALRFGWNEFWQLDDESRARVIATMSIEKSIDFVVNNWSMYGEKVMAGLDGLDEEESLPDIFSGEI